MQSAAQPSHGSGCASRSTVCPLTSTTATGLRESSRDAQQTRTGHAIRFITKPARLVLPSRKRTLSTVWCYSHAGHTHTQTAKKKGNLEAHNLLLTSLCVQVSRQFSISNNEAYIHHANAPLMDWPVCRSCNQPNSLWDSGLFLIWKEHVINGPPSLFLWWLGRPSSCFILYCSCKCSPSKRQLKDYKK